MQFRMLNIFGIVWTALNCWAGLGVMIKPCFTCAQGITACNCCGVLAWLITATVFRFREAANGTNGCCSNSNSVTSETGLVDECGFYYRLIITLWAMPAVFCVLACIGGCIVSCAAKSQMKNF